MHYALSHLFVTNVSGHRRYQLFDSRSIMSKNEAMLDLNKNKIKRLVES